VRFIEVVRSSYGGGGIVVSWHRGIVVHGEKLRTSKMREIFFKQASSFYNRRVTVICLVFFLERMDQYHKN
jgi:hypothetical protein